MPWSDTLTNGNKIQMIQRPRGKRGGGIAILSRKSKITITEYKIKTSGHEILVTKGKIQNNSRPMFIIAVYIKPSLTRDKKNHYMRTLTDIVTKIKTDHKSPYICVAGDFNRMQTNELTDLFHDINEADSPQQERRQDLIF